tara:strand:+ start:4738 stop:5208 length:471 start_codon:yes stop_codon:yes gene_type:complete
MKLNNVQKRLLSQKQVKKPYMMKGGTLPKAQTGPTDEMRKLMENRRPPINPGMINVPVNPNTPPGPGIKTMPNIYAGMDSTQLANVFKDLYGGIRFMNTGLEGTPSDRQNQIMQMFIESQGTFNPKKEYPMFRDLMGQPSFKKGGTTKGSGSNGVL